MPAAKTKAKRKTLDPVRFYAEEVLGSGIVAGPYVRLACQRHLEDLTEGKRRGLKYDNDLAHVAFEFWEQLELPEGGKFELIDWQQFCVGSLLAWLGADGYRRFRTAYIEAGKGQGKSPLMGGLGLYGSLIDDEPLPENYVCATKREQAEICWNDAVNICKNSEVLEGRYQAFSKSLYFPENGGSLKPMSADKKQSGFRPHFGLVDELHEHTSDVVVQMVRAGFKRRNQPLLVEITNTPQSEKSVCGSHRDYSIRVLNKVYRTEQTDQWFAYICGLDEEDDWKDESVWIKANPSLGTVVTLKYLRERVNDAAGMPDQEDEVKRLNFCIMSGRSKRAINLTQWDKNNPSLIVTPEQLRSQYLTWMNTLRNRECYGGLDLSLVSDLTSLGLFFPPTEEHPRPALLSWYWCPSDDIVARSRAGVPYDVWSRQGWIEATEGNTTDLKYVFAKIVELYRLFKIVRLAYDRTFAGLIVQPLIDEGCDVLDYGQGFLSLSPPTKTLLRYVKSSSLEHGSHPVTRFCAENLVLAKDPSGSWKPDKERSPEKIDGISAGVNGIGAWLDKREKPNGPSVYEQKGQLLA